MDLPDFIAQHSDNRQGVDLTEIGPASNAVFLRIGNEGLTRSLIASVFWRVFVASPAYPRWLFNLNASKGAELDARPIVVPRPDRQRFDLLCLDPNLEAPLKTIDVGPSAFSDADIAAGVSKVRREGVSRFIDGLENLVHEVLLKQTMTFTLAAAPPSERLSVPAAAQKVESPPEESTAGVLVSSNRVLGEYGVTAALHAVRGASTATVGGLSGVVRRTDAVTDSAFISLTSRPRLATVANKGVMSHIAPRGSQSASFVGWKTSATTTITGWDPQIPSPSSSRQALVYTGRDAQPGDSGAALVTDDDYIVGFAFERSRPGHSPVQCSWVWAESVLHALDVTLA